ncbi:DUF4097 domain-containing protein [Isoptericola sp. 4D.3]|uniref:DUF4097 domain-containing protein n=1 Tax=Isoptericola peretonis TaxID=2918523 RepID=A0ABT0J8F3_9MICO|nr:DUF4097 domain-containing protein [Isoptericola sp. 4D.3]
MSTETWAVAAPQTIDVEHATGVTLRLQDGRADVVADPAATGVRVELLEVGAKPVQVTRDGDRLRIGYESSVLDSVMAKLRNPRQSERAVVRVVVPPEGAVDVGTLGADVEVTGGRLVAVKTVTGAVRVSGTTGPLSLKTVSGDVAVDGHAGDVSATVASGRLALSGDLARVSLSTVSGAATITAAGPSPLITAKTVSGAIDLRLPASTPVNLKVRGASGQVVLDGSVLPSAGATLVVDHAEQPADGRSAAYLSATVTAAHVTVDRR